MYCDIIYLQAHVPSKFCCNAFRCFNVLVFLVLSFLLFGVVILITVQLYLQYTVLQIYF